MTAAPVPVAVWLTFAELAVAHAVAGVRIAYAIKRRLGDRYGAGKRDYDAVHILGARAELAVAKAFNLYWPPAYGELGRTDVGDCLNVRAIDKSTNRLRIAPDDDATFPFVLVDASDCPAMSLVGWIWPADARQHDEWLCDPSGVGKPAHFVPRSELRDLAELPLVRPESIL